MTLASPIQTAPRQSFAEHSHPEADERPSPKIGADSQALRLRLRDFKEQENLSNQQLARKLGFKEGTPVSKYLNDKYDRADLDVFEARALDLLRTSDLRQKLSIDPLRTSVTKQVENVLDSIRQTGPPGVIHGEAGLGKTTAILSYLQKNPSAILITANRCQNSERGFIQLLIQSAGKHGYKQNQSHWNYIIERFLDTDTLIIIDHAQRLQKAAVDAIFDFHDQTRCPVAFIGNPAILEKVSRDANNHSRALKEYDCKLQDIPKVARYLVDQFTDEGEAIYEHAIRVVKRPGKGRLRALVNLLRSAVDHMKDPDLPGGIDVAFQVACSESIHHKA